LKWQRNVNGEEDRRNIVISSVFQQKWKDEKVESKKE